MGAARGAWGGIRPLATAHSASILRAVWPWASILPSSSIAKGTNMWRPLWEVETGLGESSSALNFLSLTCLAVNPGMVATLDIIELQYTVVTTPSIMRWRPPSAKSKTTMPLGRVWSPGHMPMASLTMEALGTSESSTIPQRVLISP